MEPNIKEHVSRLCERLGVEARNGPVDLAKWFACFSFDVLSSEMGLRTRLEDIYLSEKAFGLLRRRIIGIYLMLLERLLSLFLWYIPL